MFNPGSHEETPSDRGKTYRTSTKKEDSTNNKDILQQQIAKSNAAALAAAAALSAAAENKPVGFILLSFVVNRISLNLEIKK